MKVLHINSYYSVSPFYKNLYDKQSENGLDIDVFLPIKHGYKTNHPLGIYTSSVPCYYSADRVLFHLKQMRINNAFEKTLGKGKYDIIHAHSLYTNGYLAYKLKRKNGTPYIVAVRNTDVNIFFNRMPHLRPLGNLILQNSTQVIFLSPAYRDDVINRYVSKEFQEDTYAKTCIVPNGINDFWFQNIGTPKIIYSKNEIKLLFVGVINKNKNIMAIVNTCIRCIGSGYNVKLTMVGNVGDYAYFSKIVKYPFVSYLPFVTGDELLNIYRTHDIFVMPSKKESFGLVYAEAMSQGLPVVYTRGQGFDKHFDDGEVGFSVDTNNVEDIANKVQCIINNYSAISARCIEKVNKFKWDKIEEEYRAIYEESKLSSQNRI